ncbi:MAG: hypothetical protein JNG84_15295 [Archangium sp.]|nr:hypothetical protein [Archangium sp.]
MRTLLLLALLCGAAALADRPFPATWQSAPLTTSAPDVQTWVNARYGRANAGYTRFDVRVLVAQPVAPKLDTLYGLELDLESFGVPARTIDPRLASVWRYGFTSADDVVGVGVLAKLGLGFSLLDVEARLVVDKRVGNVLLAFNASAARTAWWAGPAGIDTRFEQSLAAQYTMQGAFSAGFEARAREAFMRGVYQGTALLLGPTCAYSSKRWWLSIGLSLQVGADKAVADRGNGEIFEVRDNERFGARVAVGVVLD